MEFFLHNSARMVISASGELMLASELEDEAATGGGGNIKASICGVVTSWRGSSISISLELDMSPEIMKKKLGKCADIKSLSGKMAR